MPKKTLKKRPDGLYQTSICIGKKPNGTPIRKTFYARTLKELNIKAAEYERRFRLGILSNDENMTFGVLSELWIKEYKPKVRASTRDMYERILKKHLYGLASYKLREIKAHQLQSIINQLAASGKSASMLKKIKIAAAQIMQIAMDNDIVYKNVFSRIKIPEIPAQSRRPLSEEEQDLVMRTFAGHRMGIPALLLLFCGIRRGELIALTWDDISVLNRTIIVNKGAVFVHNQPLIESPKTAAGNRTIPIPDIILEAIKNAQEQAKSKMVCPSISGKIMSASAFRKLWNSYLNYLNIEAGGRNGSRTHPKIIKIDHLTPHLFRHTYATILYDAGVDVKSAQILLGHADITVTLKIYTHLSLQKQTDAIITLNQYCMKRMREQ